MNVWSISDKGSVRSQNQDSCRCFVDGDRAFLLVCDGMGGAKAGDVASALAAETFTAHIKSSEGEIPQRMLDALDEANQEVYDLARSNPDYDGMGTTLVAAAVQGSHATVVNVGDSRCYYMTGTEIRQITEDHSLVALLTREGQLTPEEARNHPKKNIITRALGTDAQIFGDLFEVELEPGSLLLLCSDGLSNMLDDQELLYEVIHQENRDDCCQRLLDIALQRGAPDNVTIVLLETDGPTGYANDDRE